MTGRNKSRNSIFKKLAVIFLQTDKAAAALTFRGRTSGLEKHLKEPLISERLGFAGSNLPREGGPHFP